MSTINPSLSSVTLANFPQQTALTPKQDLKLDEKSTPNTTSGNNTTFTLSNQKNVAIENYLALGASQSVRDTTATENRENEANQTTSGLSYASNLQTQTNYYMQNNPTDKDDTK